MNGINRRKPAAGLAGKIGAISQVLVAIFFVLGLVASVYARPSGGRNSAGKAIVALYLRGRVFDDLDGNGIYGTTDKLRVGFTVTIGRLDAAGNLMSVAGEATSDATGIYQINFMGGAGGIWGLANKATGKVLLSFTWPTDVLSHGVSIPIAVVKTSTKTATRTRTATRTATRSATRTSSRTKTTSRTTTKSRTKTSTTKPFTTTKAIWPLLGPFHNTLQVRPKGVHVDASGNVYVMNTIQYGDMTFYGMTIPTAMMSILLVKFTALGVPIWNVTFTGPSTVEPFAFNVQEGTGVAKVFIAGNYNGGALKISGRATSLAITGSNDGFFAVIDGAAGAIDRAEAITAGSGNDVYIYAGHLGPSSRIYIGATCGNAGTVTLGTLSLDCSLAYTGFVAYFNLATGAWTWIRKMTSVNSAPRALAIKSNGTNIYVLGEYFDYVESGTTKIDAFDAYTLGVFLFKLSPTDGSIAAATNMTENTIFAPKSLNFGPGGALYAGLLLEGTYKLSSGATATSNNQDVFIVKYDSSLAIKAHTLYGGSGYDDFGAVEVSPSGDVWVVLNTDAADVGSLVPSTNSRFAPVIAKFNAGLTTKKNETLIKQATGNDYYFGYSIACDLQGNAYVGVGVVADGPFFSWGARSINGTGLGEYSVVAKMADSMLPGKP